LVKLFVDILRQKGMMTDVNGCRTKKTDEGEATAYCGRLGADVVQRPDTEVVMTKILTGAMIVVLLVGTALTAANLQGRQGANRQGLMPEVRVTAEIPRLVMPTVEVHAVRMVAMSGSDLHIY
jgi:hypothetical protein